MSEIYKNGTTYVVRVSYQGKRHKIYTGMRNRRQVERFADRIEELKTAKLVNVYPAELASWTQALQRSNSKLYDKLCAIGLLESREQAVTLDDLCNLFFQNRDDDRNTPCTCLHAAWRNLFMFFDADVNISDITVADAIKFHEHLRSGLNEWNKPYSDLTYKNIMTCVRGIFNFAVNADILTKSPFRDIHAKVVYSRGKDFYYSLDLVNKMLELCEDPILKTAIILGRFAGVRGCSELYPITMDAVHWSKSNAYGYIIINGPKTHRVDSLPLLPIMEAQFKVLQKAGYKGRIFKGIRACKLSGLVAEILYKASGLVIERPWYNLRKSYCCDLMEKIGSDPLLYESLARHSFRIGMKCYQILHPERKIKGWDKLFE